MKTLLVLPAAVHAAKELDCDVAVIGGGVGGCAAALAALRNGMRVILTEETDWIGGQLTAQAVPPDEHPWIESFGCTRLYREYRNAVRDYYRSHYPLTDAARAIAHFNPGNSWVSRITHEPRVSLAVLEAMLAPHSKSGRLIVLLRHEAVAADVSRDRVRAVRVRNLETGGEGNVHARYFLDATELGDLLPLTKTEYVTGSESQRQTGEPHAAGDARPNNMQAFTCCFAMDYLAGEDHTIQKPDEYAFWREYVPELRPPWTGKLFSLDPAEPATLKPRRMSFDPSCDSKTPRCLWTYRRILDRKNFAPGSYASDITLVNWPQNDYWLGNICEVTREEAAHHIHRAKQLSLSLLYWLQTEIARPDGGQGWPGLRLRPDVVGAKDGLAKYPYVRESRRILAELTVVEQQLGDHFRDSAGVGSYRIDLHPSSGGDNYIDIASKPFEIPLGALIPRRVENLLAAAKNIGTTHITNGCYRLHPVEWNIGEAAGSLAAEAVRRRTSPRTIRNHGKLLAEFQSTIRAQGIEMAWPNPMPR
ncbi:MAG TPA: FAD-dependent oxidoreductase [Bryobacteraceae bacterium]|nr:FAD-dependent oxidoreductase [Bryobacteraceae bacterium]